MEEYQNKQPAVVEQAGSQEELCRIWDLTLASTVDILSKWQDQPQWMKKKLFRTCKIPFYATMSTLLIIPSSRY